MLFCACTIPKKWKYLAILTCFWGKVGGKDGVVSVQTVYDLLFVKGSAVELVYDRGLVINGVLFGCLMVASLEAYKQRDGSS